MKPTKAIIIVTIIITITIQLIETQTYQEMQKNMYLTWELFN